ncbi:MAG: glutathione S-transferase [Gammaproteobacteria bacterium]
MKFYDCSMAPNPRRVRIFIKEKGLDIPSVEVDLFGGENLKEDYLSKNIWGLCPALELDDGTVISEAPAVCSYLNDIHPEPPLFGTTPLERAQVISWDRHMEHSGMQSVIYAFRNNFPDFAMRGVGGREGDKIIPELIERGKNGIKIYFERLEKRLSDSPYIAGKSYSMADITGLVAIDFAKFAEFEIPDANTHSRKWYEKVSSRPATQV